MLLRVAGAPMRPTDSRERAPTIDRLATTDASPDAVSTVPSPRSRRPGVAQIVMNGAGLPLFLTADEVAALLRTTRPAVYAMVARGQVPGTTRIGRRVLFRSAALLHWLDQNRAPSPKE